MLSIIPNGILLINFKSISKRSAKFIKRKEIISVIKGGKIKLMKNRIPRNNIANAIGVAISPDKTKNKGSL